MKNLKTLITGAFKYNESQIEELEKMNLEIEYIQDERKESNINFEEIELVICNSLFLYQDIKKFKNLKMIQLTSAGLDRVPLEYIKEKGIKLYNARGVYSIPMAEWTILKILETYKKSRDFYKKQEEKKWNKEREIIELDGKIATIVGYGNVGKEVAKRLKAFGVTINIVDITEKKDIYIDNYYNFSELDDAIISSDIIILTLPLIVQTEKKIKKKKLKMMKDDSILINIARGKIIKEKDLIEILKTNKFRGVILDVFEEEPLDENNELWDFSNVIITPHNSFVGENNNKRLFKVIKDNIINYRKEEIK